MSKYPPPILDLPPEETPFNRWKNVAVNEMEMAMDGPQDYHVRRLHLFRCFDAVAKMCAEVAKAEKTVDMLRSME